MTITHNGLLFWATLYIGLHVSSSDQQCRLLFLHLCKKTKYRAFYTVFGKVW